MAMKRRFICCLPTMCGLFVLGFPICAQSADLVANYLATASSVVDIRNAGDGSGRLFLIQQEGLIQVLKDGELQEQPFLDIRDRVADAPEDYFEEYNYGLLSVAFAPQFAGSGILYANYTDNLFTQTISRFRVPANKDVADPSSEEILLSFTLPSVSHNGGHLKFGPDGYLYISVGDGQESGRHTDDPQKLDNLMGKILRIDVSGSGAYAIPPDNPFIDTVGARAEIWAYGLRNPWRIAFDPKTGDLFIGDAGEFNWEEVDFQMAGSRGGQNYGWRLMEGTHCRNANCDLTGLTLPVAEFGHTNPNPGEGCTVVIGGEAYRGSAYPALEGVYLYADGCTGKTWGLSCRESGCQSELLAEKLRIVGGPFDDKVIDFVQTFGAGEDGSIYLSDFGWVYKLSNGPLVDEPQFSINAALSDAWFNPATPGQGFFVNVLPESRQLFVGFFTYEFDSVAVTDQAGIGDSAQRWLTAQGTYQGDSALLGVTLSKGGAFDDARTVINQSDYGTLELHFDPDCMHAEARLEIPSAGLDRVIPLQRIASDKRQECLYLASDLRLAR